MKKNKAKILITGSNGFVAKSLIKFLKKKNVVIFRITKKKYDLSKKKEFKKIFLKFNPDFIVHLASRTVSKKKNEKEDKLQLKNTFLPVKNLIDNINFCKNLKKIIFCGSIEEYGNIKTPFKESYKPKPLSSYGLAKYSGYKYVIKKIKQKNTKFVWLRPSLMFGPNDNSNRFLGSIFYNLKNNKKTYIRLGSQVRDYLFVEDFCKIIYEEVLFFKIKNYNLLNVSSGNWILLKDLLRLLKKKIPKNKFRFLIANKSYDNSKLINSSILFKKFYPKFRFTPFNISLNKTMISYGFKIN